MFPFGEFRLQTRLLFPLDAALQIDSSAAFDRSIPARGFRRWKALPEIKDTVSSFISLLVSLLRITTINSFLALILFVFDTYSHLIALIFRVLTCKCLCQIAPSIEQRPFKPFSLRFHLFLRVRVTSSPSSSSSLTTSTDTSLKY